MSTVIVGGEENVNPNSLPSRNCPCDKTAKYANPTRHHLKAFAHADAIANPNTFPLSKLWKRLTWHNALVCFLVKALVISLLINLHIVSVLSQIGPESSFSRTKEYIKAPRVMDDKNIFACVRNVSNQCELYPCVRDSGVYIETVTPIDPFGYAGRFVHRDADVSKPLMQTIGDKGWGSGCVISDEYRFVYIHVLKSGGTATKEVRNTMNSSITSLSVHFHSYWYQIQFLRKSLCGEEDKDCKRVDPHILRPSGCRAAILNYTSYFTFSFVRNPFSRMYSMYSMMDGFPIESGKKVTDTFSFHDFVMKPNERKNHTAMHAGHYDRQKNFIFSNLTCPSFDFLGRVEHYDEDMRTILNYLNATKLVNYLDGIGGSVKPANTWGSDKKKSIGGDLRKEYISKQVVRTVAAVYRKDFELLGYSKDDVPTS